MDEAGEAVTADNELGEMGSFFNGGRTSDGGDGGGANGGAGWDRELQGGEMAEGGRIPAADEDEDEDEVRCALQYKCPLFHVVILYLCLGCRFFRDFVTVIDACCCPCCCCSVMPLYLFLLS